MKLKMVLAKHAKEIYETVVQEGLIIRLRIYTYIHSAERNRKYALFGY